MLTDPISDFLSRLSNANHKFQERVDLPSSKLKRELARVLKDEGYVSDFKHLPDRRQGTLRVFLKYLPDRTRVIQGVKRVSKPGLRIYRPCIEIPTIQNGLGIAILSTSKGVLSGQKAREKKLGGEILCYVW